MTQSQSAAEVRELRKRFVRRGPWVLDGVSLRVEPGEVVALVGPSGCGKTTLLRILAGLETPSEGRVELRGEQVADGRRARPPERRDIGMVFQDHALFPHLRVSANVGFGLNRLDRGTRARRVSELLGRVGLAGLEKRYVHQLSGGQRQRVALARALARNSPLVLLDEPLSSLDEPLRDALRDEVAGLIRDAKAAAVWVTHRAADALAVADRIAYLAEGRLVQQGSPQSLYERPESLDVARFFGPINAFSAERRGGQVATPFGALSRSGPDGTYSVVIRPECIRLDPESDVNADIERTSYQGSDVLLSLLIGEHRLVARLPSATPLPEGAQARVSVDWDRLHLIS